MVEGELFERIDAKVKERGFTCMRLILFLTDSGKTEWEEWHTAHIEAATGNCQFREICSIYARTITTLDAVQLPLFPHDQN